MDILAYLGVVATIWIVVGVSIAGAKYKNYSHLNQFLSELGASGSPTEKLSPLINNYPLGLIFTTFGLFLAIQFYPGSLIMLLIGLLIIIHGVSTWVAGFFPMDADPYTKQPTVSCKIHTTAGFLVSVSLAGAMMFGFFESTLSYSFKFFTFILVVAWLIFSIAIAIAYVRRGRMGLYQRLGYATQLIWLSGLSLYLA